jgi:hypothetical protein
MAAPAPKRLKEDKPKLQSLLFEALEADGSNYMEWSIDLRTFLASEDFQGTIKKNNAEIAATPKNKALLMIRRHLDYSLRKQYLTLSSPHELWKALKARFLHEKTMHLPQARSEWIQLRVMDFSDLLSFNAELHRIVSLMRLCGQHIEESEMIDKTLSTFPPAAAILAQQYRNMNFLTHARLMSYLLAAEKQQQILLKNAESRPNKEVHTAELAARKPKVPKGKDSRGKSKQPPPKAKDRSSPSKNSHQKKTSEGEPRSCHKCGRKGHIAKDCRAGDYLAQMYKELQQLKSKQPEAHAVDAPSFEDTENYMVQLIDLGESTRLEPTFEDDPKDQTTGPAPRVLSLYSGSNHREMALLDSATTHTILRDPLYFSFSGTQTEAWQSCELLTVAGRRNFQFREGRASIVLPGGTTLRIEHAMYAPSAH